MPIEDVRKKYENVLVSAFTKYFLDTSDKMYNKNILVRFENQNFL